ncbi:hypothetical protein BIW11_11980, partial [Tropilaelaps mercedesae]
MLLAILKQGDSILYAVQETQFEERFLDVQKRHRDSLRVDSADSGAVVKTNVGVGGGAAAATTGAKEQWGSLCNARSRENSIGFEASATGSSID